MAEVIDDIFEGLPEIKTVVNVDPRLKEIAENKGLGFKGMDDEQKEQFMQSDEMRRHGVEILHKQYKPNFAGKTVKDLFGIDTATTLSRNCFDCDDFDIDTFYKILNQSMMLQRFVDEGLKVYPMFQHLCEDIFLGLYLYKPKLKPIEDMHASARINRKLAELYVNTPQFIKFRGATKLDDSLTMIAMQSIAGRMLDIIKEFARQNKEAMEKLDDIMKKEDEIDDILEQQAAQEVEQQNGGAYGQATSSGQGSITIEQARQMAEQMSKELDDIVDTKKLANNSVQVIHTAYEDPELGGDSIEERKFLLEAFGFGVGENSRISFESKIPLTEHLLRTKKLRPLAEMIGRFKQSAENVQKKKVKDGSTEIVSVTNGDDIQSVLPSELLKLSKPSLKGTFYSDYSEKRLMQYDKRSTRSKNKGPIVMCIDVSGSMSGKKEQWSKAMAMAVIDIAQSQKRACAVILYDSHAQDPIILEAGEVDPQKIIDICETFTSGGTSFEAPLRKAVEVIKKYRKFKDADIMFITDGDCAVGETYLRQFKKEKEELEFNVQGVVININGRKRDVTSLDDFCEKVTNIQDIAELMDADSETNKNLFASL